MRFYEDNYMQLLKSNVTAVFAVSDFYALEFMRFLQGKNIQIPEDIQIIGFDDNMASRESNPSLTTIHQEANLRQLNVWRQCAMEQNIRQKSCYRLI